MLQYLNLGIDFGAVAAFALAFKFDLDKAAELSDNVKEKLTKNGPPAASPVSTAESVLLLCLS